MSRPLRLVADAVVLITVFGLGYIVDDLEHGVTEISRHSWSSIALVADRDQSSRHRHSGRSEEIIGSWLRGHFVIVRARASDGYTSVFAALARTV